MNILVVLEQRENKLKSCSLEALTVARQLAQSGDQIYALAYGEQLDSLVADLKEQSIDELILAESAEVKNYNSILYTDAALEVCSTKNIDVVVGSATLSGRDFLPRLSAKLDAAIVTDVVEASREGEDFIVHKPFYAGKVSSKIAMRSGVKRIISLRPNTFEIVAATEAKELKHSKLSKDLTTDVLKLVEIKASAQQKQDLTEANIIISGGRSLGSAENFKIIESCAEVVGAAVGASRAAVDAGYASHSMQVGQTGKTVNPKLYVACGISGAIQHLAGMRTSKVIVAINKDEQAPIFSVADYGIIGDLFEVVPALEKELKALER